jgi:hypothetical protein
MTKKKEGRRIGRCECGGSVRGHDAFGRLFSWCERCTPVEAVNVDFKLISRRTNATLSAKSKRRRKIRARKS